MDGSRAENHLEGNPSIALCSAAWEQENVLKVAMRMVETCNERTFTFTFDGDNLEIADHTNNVFFKKPFLIKLVKA